MDKRQRLLDLAEGRIDAEYTPAAFFLHFPREFHCGSAAIDKHEAFFRETDMDLCKVQFELAFPAAHGAHPRDLSRLSPEFFEPQVKVVRGLVERLGGEAVVVCTLYSPFMIAGGRIGEETLDRMVEDDPEGVAEGLDAVADDLLSFVRAAAAVGLDGFYHSTQGRETNRLMSPDLYDRAIRPSDLKTMRECERLGRFNILHICDYHRSRVGGYKDLSSFADYPGHVVSCHADPWGPAAVTQLFGRPFFGGMDRLGALAHGVQDEVKHCAREALGHLPPGSMLGADCTVPPETPWSNLRAAIDVAHGK